jgi:tetraprenyl-beta-curcumene synthase
MIISIGSNQPFGLMFASAARSYWLSVFPVVCRELRQWLSRAGEIPDPVLRELALEAQRSKRGNIEGAAAFAAFVPSARRTEVVRALVAFQTAYDYADTLSEQPSSDPSANGQRLHQALLIALEPDAPHIDYYLHHPRREDGGYLGELVDSCRSALSVLRSYAAVMGPARDAAARIVSYQSLNLDELRGGHEGLARWASMETPAGMDLRWWETAASAGSSLSVFALIAAAAHPELLSDEAAAIDEAYFPWVGALHTLLDSLLDRREDAEAGQRSLLDYYTSPEETADRMGLLAEESLRLTRALPGGRQHALILAGMTGHYLCTPEASTPDALPTTRKVLKAMGELAAPTMLVMNARRAADRGVRWRSRWERGRGKEACRPTAACGGAASGERELV